MTFAWPFMLVGLVLVPIVLALDLHARRRRARYAVAFTNVNVLRSVVPRVPPWRRYLPLVFLLAALSVLIVGLARPQRAISVARKQATVTLAMDTSGSMVAQDVTPSRLGAATAAAEQFVRGLPSSYRVSLVPFASTATVAVAPTYDHSKVTAALSGLQANGGTAIGDAISLALAIGRPPGEQPGKPPLDSKTAKGRVILLLSDGSSNAGIDPMVAAAQAKAEGVRVYTIAFGTANGVVSAGAYGQIVSVPPDPAALQAVAKATNGESFTAADVDTLKRVYKNIGSQVGTTTEQQDATYAFAGLGAVLLTIAGLLGTLWRSQVV
jgi:Ca-activated chloride channel homolog